MKQLFTLISLTYFLVSCGRYVPTEIENGKLLGVIPMQYGKGSYQVTQRIQATREDLFRQVRRWAAFRIPDPTQALSIGDNLLGDLITYGSISQTTLSEKRLTIILPQVNYTISVECYENAYRVTLTNFHIGLQTNIHPIEVRHTTIPLKKARLQYREIDRRALALIADLKDFVLAEVKQVAE